MRVLRIELEGITCSFRYPHVHVGRQPTFRMPPPATIYGHICSAAGEWIDPSSLRFGYSFSASGRGNDYEHIYQLSPGSGKKDKKWAQVENLKGDMVPVRRDFMLHPKLVLYIDSPEDLEHLFQSFQSPRYPVILGRSQDMAGYRSVEITNLETAGKGYFENTLLAWTFRMRTKLGTPVLMPKFIDTQDRQRVSWAPYIVLENRLFLSDKPVPEQMASPSTIERIESDKELWVDPDTPEVRDSKRIIVWHTFQGD
ncbi:MAG: type I-B CRISPR-associated protein Cas5 [Chloroflexi bacterium]|nr:type I-B CRISPR-associated protein Cas5 [Chloroflexota bacterium]